MFHLRFVIDHQLQLIQTITGKQKLTFFPFNRLTGDCFDKKKKYISRRLLCYVQFMQSNVFNFIDLSSEQEYFNHQYSLIDCNIAVKRMIVYGFIENLYEIGVLSKC